MKIQHQYIGDWPVREAYKQRLKYHSEMAKKKAHREAGSALIKACFADIHSICLAHLALGCNQRIL